MPELEFDSPVTAAVARDLAIIQIPELDRDELNFSVGDLEKIIAVAKGKFKLISEN